MTEDPRSADPSSPDTDANAAPASDFSKETERLTQELAELKDKYVRTYAEMENIRRRHERDRSDLVKFALEQAFKDFLPVLDSFEKALPDDGTNAPHAKGSDRAYYDGMVMVKRQLFDTFKKHGLEVIKAQGQAFDPNLHQAIQRVESADVDVETVGGEFARGYVLNGRLLRPAMVSVLSPAGG